MVGAINIAGITLAHGFSVSDSVGALDDTTFSVGSNNYVIDAALKFVSDGKLRFSLASDLSTTDRAQLTLHVCDDSFAFSAATLETLSTYDWSTSIDDWSSETTRTLYLSVPSDDTTAPSPSSATVASNGITVNVDFDEALVEPGTAVAGAFTLTADGVERDIQNFVWGAATLIFDVASGTKIYAGQTVRLSYDKTAAGADALEDAAGNEVASFTDFAVTNNSTTTITTPPEIVPGGVQVTSTPMATADTYGLGETIAITVTFDKAVTVGGTPRIRFHLDGGVKKWAGYSSGSGGTALEFTYTVQARDMDDDGIWLPANVLQLAGGTISATADNTVDAILTYAEPGLQPEHKVDGSLTRNPRPAIVTDGVQVTSTPMATADTYGLGETIAITVNFDKAVTVDTSGGTPRIAFRVDGDLLRWAEYSSGSGGTALVFTYTVQAGDMDADGIRLGVNSIEPFGGTIRDAADPIVDATLTYADPGLQSGHKVDGSLTTADATLSALALSGVTLDPTFVSSTETYTATVVNGVTETTVTATPTQSGATVAFKDGDDNALTNPVTLAVGATVIKAVVTAQDGTTTKTYMVTVARAPAIVTVQVTSNPMATGNTYGRGETIAITVTFDNAVTVDTSGGTPRIAFHLDGGLRWAVYSSGSGDTALVFTYTVLADDRAVNGILLRGDQFDLFGGTIRAAPDNAVDATLTYADPGLQSGHKVDGSLTNDDDGTDDDDGTTPPAIVTDGVQVTSTPATGDIYGLGETIAITVTFDKAVTVDTSGGTRRPGIAFHLAGDLNQNRWAVYNSSGSGGTALVFTYTVLADDRDTDGIRLPANKLELFSATIRDATDSSVDATLTYTQPGLQSGHKVNGSLTTTATTPPAIVTDGVQVTSTPATADTYRLGETIAITVTFDNAVTVDTSGGTRRPGIAFRLDGGLLRWAVYNSSASGGTALVFTYTVLADDMDADGIWLLANKLEPFSGTIRAAADPTVDASLTYAEPGLQSGHKVKGSLTTTTDDDDGVIIFPPPPPPTGNNSPTADAGPDQTDVWEGALVMLDGSGSSDPDDDPLRYRWNQLSGEPVVLSSQDIVNPTFTAPQGLTADAVLSFRLLVTDPEGLFASDTVTITVEQGTSPPGDQIYYFPHLAVGAGWQTTITYINYSPQEVSCQTEFLSDQGTPLLVSFADRGTVVSRSDVLPPGGSVHAETNVDLGAPLAPGWARAACTGPLKASLLFRGYDSEGMPTGEAGVNATTVPATRFVTFAEQGEGRFGTGVAYANPSDTAAVITFTARGADGQMLASENQQLSAGGHGAQNMSPLFGLPSFSGSLEVTSTEPIVSLSLNNEADPVFSSLPPGDVDAAAQGPQGMTTYYFPHLAVGAGWQTTITYINYSPQEVTCQTNFLSDDGAPLLVSFAGLGTVVSRSDDLPPGGSVHQETNVELNAPLAPGWVRATCTGPVKASLLFRRYDSEGVPTGEAGINAATVPATRFVTFAEQGEGQSGTGVAYANPSPTAALVTFTAKDAAGEVLASVDETLLPNGHDAHNMALLFGLSSFSGSLEVTSTAPIVSLSLNFEADPVFSSLPPGEVDASATAKDTDGEVLASLLPIAFEGQGGGLFAASDPDTDAAEHWGPTPMLDSVPCVW